MAKEVQKKEANLPVDSSIFNGQVSGFEGTARETFKTPFLKILQGLSPELKRNDAKFIQDAQQGQFCNSATQEVYDVIDIIVLKIEHSLVIWKPDRGGFVGRINKSYEENVVVKKDGLQKWDAEGNDVMDTIEFFCLNIDNPTDIFILSLSGASFKHARTFATRLRMLQADGKPVGVAWAGVWKMTTTEEKNDKGSWYTINAPEFQRFITGEEKEKYIIPAIEMLKNAETDYSSIDSSGNSEEVKY